MNTALIYDITARQIPAKEFGSYEISDEFVMVEEKNEMGQATL